MAGGPLRAGSLVAGFVLQRVEAVKVEHCPGRLDAVNPAASVGTVEEARSNHDPVYRAEYRTRKDLAIWIKCLDRDLRNDPSIDARRHCRSSPCKPPQPGAPKWFPNSFAR